jgi:hypothetical protein
MPIYPNEPLITVRQRLLDGMTKYMRGDSNKASYGWDCGYSQEHIDHCAALIDGYLAKVVPNLELSQEEIRAAVKQIVLDLNALNRQGGHKLIETDQREYLCQLILVTATKAGLHTDKDITEEWREW